MQHITSIKYKNYKSFKDFSVALNEFNILVGPNNAGKSTVIGSLKILSEGIRRAKSRKPIFIESPTGHQILGYELDLSQIPVATENVFHNYDDSSSAIIRYRLSDGSHLQIFFPERGACFFNIESDRFAIRSPSDFKKNVQVDIGYVPILGPVEHLERLYQKQAARLALLSHTASRNFRNIWFHYREDFVDFRELIKMTWPGLDISPPEVNYSSKDPTLDMFCPEERIPREIYWAGFGFQVWCQMLTFIIKNKNASLFLIDEPDIYLHSDLQRQLLGILKGLGPDIVIATHSTELISEADLNDILLINKVNKSAKRIKDPSQLREIFKVLGSNLNPILTQIAKSKRVLFVEGKDFLIFSRIARNLRKNQVANRSEFAVVPVEGFNPTKLKAFKEGIEKTIGSKILSAVIFDRDYKSQDEINLELKDLRKGSSFCHIHSRKEIENFLLVPTSIEKAIKSRIVEVNKRAGKTIKFDEDINEVLSNLSSEFKHKTFAQLQSHRFKYEKSLNPKIDESTITEKILKEFDTLWEDIRLRLSAIPGKEMLSSLNSYLQDNYSITITHANIISSMSRKDIPEEIVELIAKIDQFRKEKVK
ncbi:ATP-dependent nuclease [Flagellimonas sp.]|uniref:ATP-dependent nuclease n=1 Tax=Flagellimonas sp. TaxID=2058762 RepID=UPI003B5BB3D4